MFFLYYEIFIFDKMWSLQFEFSHLIIKFNTFRRLIIIYYIELLIIEYWLSNFL